MWRVGRWHGKKSEVRGKSNPHALAQILLQVPTHLVVVAVTAQGAVVGVAGVRVPLAPGLTAPRLEGNKPVLVLGVLQDHTDAGVPGVGPHAPAVHPHCLPRGGCRGGQYHLLLQQLLVTHGVSILTLGPQGLGIGPFQ